MEPLLALLLTFLLMWALLIRPQQRRMRQHQSVVASLRPGDEIVTAGGIYGIVTEVDSEAMMVEVAPGIELRVLRQAVSQRVTPTDGDEGDEEDDEEDDDEDGGGDATGAVAEGDAGDEQRGSGQVRDEP
jgi:preprotein translocase subunit YajC